MRSVRAAFEMILSLVRGRVLHALARHAISGFCTLLIAAGTAGAVSSAPFAQPSTARDGQSSPPDAAEELLQDGLDALSDDRPDLARQFFNQLQLTYPGTVEAGRGALELEDLQEKSRNAADRGTARPKQVMTMQLNELRRRFLIEAGDRVFFAENSDAIGARARATLDQQARWLKSQPGLVVTLIGRADDGGTAAQALLLSNGRAEAVRQRLLAAGIADDKIFIEARGDRDPLAVCRDVICKAQNRHTESLLGYAQQANDTAER